MNKKIDDVKTELKAKIDDVKTEVKAEMKTEIKELKEMLERVSWSNQVAG